MAETYIYFARSLRGDSEDHSAVYDFVELTIRNKGCRPQFDIPVPASLRTVLGNTRADQYIYRRDLYWIDHCHAMIAEVTTPSHGVGFEIAYARFQRQIPLLCVANQGANVSAMIAGNWYINKWGGFDDLKLAIEEFISALLAGDTINEPPNI